MCLKELKFFIFLKKKAKKEAIYIVGGIFYGRYN